MFYLGLRDYDLQRLSKLAGKTNITVERLARLAFLEGLKLLLRSDGPSQTPRQRQKERLAKARSYIMDHWLQETDGQLAGATGYSIVTIRHLRAELSLLRDPASKSSSLSPGDIDYIRGHYAHQTDFQLARAIGCKFYHVANVRRTLGLIKNPLSNREALKSLIKEYWESKDDEAIGRLLDPSVSPHVVQRVRVSLGLGRIVLNASQPSFDPAECRAAITRDGYTMTEYMALRGLRYTRERFRQILCGMEIPHSPSDRLPEWTVQRRARMLGHMELADPIWLQNKLSETSSFPELAATLGTSAREIFFFVEKLGLTNPFCRGKRNAVVHLVCPCGKEFDRLESLVKARHKLKGDNCKFYCGQRCCQ